MKVSVTVTDTRPKFSQYGVSREREEFTRARVDEARLNGRTAAGLLRAIADDLDPYSVEPTEAEQVSA